jgi:hypothetical protein
VDGEDAKWAVIGGIAMQSLGIDRETDDLDILLDERGSEGLQWWQCSFDILLQKNGWIHYRDPEQDEDLYMVYGNSWVHPEYGVKVDILVSRDLRICNEELPPSNKAYLEEIINESNDSGEISMKRMELKTYYSEGIPYASLESMLQLKRYSIHTRRYQEEKIEQDFNDLCSLIDLWKSSNESSERNV